jgi:hypothetical protein
MALCAKNIMDKCEAYAHVIKQMCGNS